MDDIENLRKWELRFGIATTVTMFLYSFTLLILYIPTIRHKIEGRDIIIISALTAFWLLSLMVALGTYSHIKGNDSGATFVNFGGLLITVFLGGLGLLNLIFTGGNIIVLSTFIPVTLSIITMFVTSLTREKV